jgi:hypothetical protein
MVAAFFRLPKTKQFQYKPRYYDERKEELDKRIAQIKSEMGITDDQPEGNKYFRGDYKTHIKGQMKSYFNKARRQKRTSNVRLLVILLALLALAWYIIYF